MPPQLFRRRIHSRENSTIRQFNVPMLHSAGWYDFYTGDKQQAPSEEVKPSPDAFKGTMDKNLTSLRNDR